jgi:hypothetical protein
LRHGINAENPTLPPIPPWHSEIDLKWMVFMRKLCCCLSLLILLPARICAAADHADAYAQLVQSADGVLAYYRFEETNGHQVQDNSPRAAHAQLVGGGEQGIESAHAQLGRGIRTSGGYVQLPALGEHAAVTIEMWLNIAGEPQHGLGGLFAVEGWELGNVHLNLRNGGAIELAVNGNGIAPSTPAGALPHGQWSHLVAMYDSQTGELEIYVNGQLVREEMLNPHPAVKLDKATVGAWVSGTPVRPVLADLDELAVYSRALSLGEVRHHYRMGLGRQIPSVEYATQIAPLLAARCYDCHGPDTQESHLRLDVRDWVLRGGESGEPAIAPYDAGTSQLVAMVTTTDAAHRMPPDEDPLSSDEVALLRNWIDQGAPWPDELAGHAEPEKVATSHWSFQPVVKHDPPEMVEGAKGTGDSQSQISDLKFEIRNPIDAFIVAKLAEKNLAPSPLADKRTLIRRLYLDVLGLPPTPEQVASFVADTSPQAWANLVEQVLASPRYGERWASHWLDVVRYGDTHGFEINTPRDHAWPYRDYVIKSLNEDKPYDRFIREQIAGDQLEVDAATGFLVAAPALLSGQVGRDEPSIRLARADELHEVLVSVSAGVMGLTVGCARCHNHKFDPILQSDYYQLQAVFAGLRYGDRPVRNPAEVQLSTETSTPAAQVFGGIFTTPDPAYRLYRGDPMQRRERVAPDVPAVFGSLELSVTATDAERRTALADWLVRADNPLTPRVIANRVWQHHFGMGLVQTPSDLGVMGFKPSHPELLDWLAATFVEQGWSLKALHRLILTSHAYQQSNLPRAEALAVDANCELLWRYPPRRMEAEPIRDSVLAVAGSLDLTMGGPGFQLFKPNDNYVRNYEPKEEWGPGEWRRMVYAHRVRMEQDGVFGAFDCPDAGQPAPKRGRSTTAIQALNMLNSGFMQQQAELLAKRAESEAGASAEAALPRLFQLVLTRDPSQEEIAWSQQVVNEFGLPAVAKALLNSNEFLFIP